MEWIKQNLVWIIGFGLAGLLLFRVLFRFLFPSMHFKWGFINYFVIKKSHQLTGREMLILKRIGQEFKVTSPSSLVGTPASLDYYLALYISNLFNRKKMQESLRTRILSEVLEIRRKFALVPLATSKIFNTRFFAPGTKIRIFFTKNKFYTGVIGENRYASFVATIPHEEIAEILKQKKKVKCVINRLADAQYTFQTKILFVSTSTKPMFLQLKHRGRLSRKQLRQDIRRKVDILSDIIPVKPALEGKHTVYRESLREKTSGFIRDLSSGGCSLGGRFNLTAGQYCKLDFKILGEHVQANAKIIRTTSPYKGSDRKTLYFRFLGLPLKNRVLIQLYTYHLHPTFIQK